MKLAKEMLEWYKENRAVSRLKITDSMYMKYFRQIEMNLDYNEEVQIVFVGSIGEQGSFFHSIPCFFGELCGVAITNKGIIVAKSDGVIFPIKSTLTVQLSYFNDVTKIDRIFMSTLILDSIKETITVTLRKKDSQVFYNLIRRILIDKETLYTKDEVNNMSDMNKEINSFQDLRNYNKDWENRK